MTASSPRTAALSARLRRVAFRILLILLPVHLYVGLRLAPDLPGGEIVPLLVTGYLALSLVMIPYGTLAHLFSLPQARADRLAWIGTLAMGWFSSLFVLTLIRDLTLLIPATRAWTGESALAVVGLSLAVTVLGFVNARKVARVVRVTVPLPGLPDSLDGFTIAQLSDIHVGPTIKAPYVRGIVDRVNGLNADLVAITGDVVDGSVADLVADAAPLADLKARYGTVIVTGNHEFYSGADPWMAHFATLGMIPLRNAHRVLDHGGAALVVAGVEDYSAGGFDPARASDPEAALAGAPEGVPRVLLAHQPRSAFAARRAGVDLQLSGHTHGGQIWPWNHFVRLQQPITAGLHRLDRMWIYVSRGTGYWGPPKRFGAPSEITLVTLARG
jgi:predicted MPP superfamily phosphohydrolase